MPDNSLSHGNYWHEAHAKTVNMESSFTDPLDPHSSIWACIPYMEV